MGQPLKIVVGGYMVGYPLGGMTWHHLNYLLGLHSLGHEVWFLEDSGSYSVPYNPVLQQCNPDPAYGLNYLKETFVSVGLPLRYCYYSQFWDTHYGLNRDELAELLRGADLLLCVSGVTPLRDERPRPRRTAVIDTDPVFTQLRMVENEEFRGYFQGFDAVATFGTLIGTPECPLPTVGLDWIPTVQPIAMDHWPFLPSDSRRFTTIGKWEHGGRDVEFAGKRYRSSKEPQWRNMLDLPARVPWQMETAMQSMPQDVQKEFESRGWRITDPEPISISTAAFRNFIQQSAGEFTVAKEIYTALPSGWFSDRGACYLASGRPVVTQPSGFEKWLPAGEGLFACSSVNDAAEALNRIAEDYAAQSRAARQLEEAHVVAQKVLTELLGRIM
jgi:hypothetical protein